MALNMTITDTTVPARQQSAQPLGGSPTDNGRGETVDDSATSTTKLHDERIFDWSGCLATVCFVLVDVVAPDAIRCAATVVEL